MSVEYYKKLIIDLRARMARKKRLKKVIMSAMPVL